MMNERRHSSVSTKNILVILILGSLGQLAWLLENSWFNTFTYDCVTTNTTPIALMNALSAITATVTTFIMGTISDRAGKRKPFIRYGYLLWGIFTAGFIVSGKIRNVFWASFAVVVLDCVMTFFGSTAYDACYNAWITDISDEGNRGKVTVLGQLGLYIATGIGIAAGAIVDRFGYPAFFISIGVLVSVAGFITASFIEEGKSQKPSLDNNGEGFLKGILSSFSKESYQKNRELFLVLFALFGVMVAFQISFAYETIYANNVLHISKSVNSLLMLPVAPAAIAGAVIAGRFADKGKGIVTLLAAPLIFSAGALITSFARGVAVLVAGKVFLYGGMVMMTTSSMAMFKNLSPADERGHFEGIRMVFQVLLPMVIGPSLGSFLIEHYGLGPLIYLTTAMVSLLAVVPAWILNKSEKEGV